MNHGFTKLFGSILASTIWQETNPTRIVWITMLAMADRDGEIAASVPGLARYANVTLAECEQALAAFLSPDKYSRTTDFEGRRIEAVDGGWKLLNHAKYREAMRSLDRTEYFREKKAEERARKKARVSTNVNMSTNVNHVQPIAEAEAEACIHPNPSPAGPAEGDAERLYALYPRRQGRQAALKAIRAALKVKTAPQLSEAVQAFVTAVSSWPPADQARFVPHPATWFNEGRYDDDRSTWARQPAPEPIPDRRRAAFA